VSHQWADVVVDGGCEVKVDVGTVEGSVVFGGLVVAVGTEVVLVACFVVIEVDVVDLLHAVESGNTTSTRIKKMKTNFFITCCLLINLFQPD
jgi:hypothetical protein